MRDAFALPRDSEVPVGDSVAGTSGVGPLIVSEVTDDVVVFELEGTESTPLVGGVSDDAELAV